MATGSADESDSDAPVIKLLLAPPALGLSLLPITLSCTLTYGPSRRLSHAMLPSIPRESALRNISADVSLFIRGKGKLEQRPHTRK